MKDGGGLRRSVFLWSSFQTINAVKLKQRNAGKCSSHVPIITEMDLINSKRKHQSSTYIMTWSVTNPPTPVVFCWMMYCPRNKCIKRCYCHFNITDIMIIQRQPLKNNQLVSIYRSMINDPKASMWSEKTPLHITAILKIRFYFETPMWRLCHCFHPRSSPLWTETQRSDWFPFKCLELLIVSTEKLRNKTVKSHLSCFLWVDINVTDGVKLTDDIISCWSQATVSTS